MMGVRMPLRTFNKVAKPMAAMMAERMPGA